MLSWRLQCSVDLIVHPGERRINNLSNSLYNVVRLNSTTSYILKMIITFSNTVSTKNEHYLNERRIHGISFSSKCSSANR